MENESIRPLLEKLHKELYVIAAAEGDTSRAFADLRSDVQKLMDQSEDAPPHERESLMQHFKDSIEYFEVSHPKLTTLMNSIVNTLNNLGI